MAGTNIREELQRRGLAVQEPLEPEGYRVVFLNDDQTPIDFVAAVLVDIFGHTASRARRITMLIHESGSGVAGVYPHEIAEAKVAETTARARQHGFPLRCQMERDRK